MITIERHHMRAELLPLMEAALQGIGVAIKMVDFLIRYNGLWGPDAAQRETLREVKRLLVQAETILTQMHHEQKDIPF